ncbi:hypothetical protein B0H16DRAFT_1467497 [Mycena metata]|uniref:Uncharacterized protein n=1 Tax=Mycena metata TaxID=1033252 RepID=A0AAD7MVM5_9AGAR|nr:hypothetical protein B0H16DRAFT_1467497 [Mycena metata]
MKDDEDLAEDVPDPTDPNARDPETGTLMQEEAARRSAISSNIRGWIGQWYRAHYGGGVEQGKKNMFKDLLSTWQYYSKLHYEERVKPRFEIMWKAEVQCAKDLELEEPHEVKVRGEVTCQAWEEESEDFKATVTAVQNKEYTQILRAWEMGRAEEMSHMPEELHATVKNAALYLQPLADVIQERFSISVAIMLCGPIGELGGAIGVRSIHSGTTAGLNPKKWYNFDPVGYQAAEASMHLRLEGRMRGPRGPTPQGTPPRKERVPTPAHDATPAALHESPVPIHEAWRQKDMAKCPEELWRVHSAFAVGEKWPEDWARLVNEYMDFEAAAGYPEDVPRIGGDGRLSEVGDFLTGGQKWHSPPKIRNLGKLGAKGSYADNWWFWWRSLQPNEREVNEETGMMTMPMEMEWGKLTKMSGRNGFMQVLASLLWWGMEEFQNGSEDTSGWGEAVGDVEGMLYGALHLGEVQASTSKKGKEKAAAVMGWKRKSSEVELEAEEEGRCSKRIAGEKVGDNSRRKTRGTTAGGKTVRGRVIDERAWAEREVKVDTAQEPSVRAVDDYAREKAASALEDQ